MALAPSPALNANYEVALGQDAQFDSLRYAPFETLVHVLLPIGVLEIGLRFREQEGIDSAVKV